MSECIVKMEHISKSFPGVKALDDVSFYLNSGEVMALLGENGAGKSTLMKILSGVYTRDEGTIEVFGQGVQEQLTPKKAQELGIAIIHQELNMCGHLTVAENIFLGREKTSFGVLSKDDMNKEAKRILDDLKIDISPTTVISDLPVSKQQMVEIAKSLSTNAKILVMDEPTSALTSKEIDELFRIIRQLKTQGKGIAYISHRLDELVNIVDNVTIMRDGKFILMSKFQDISMQEIIQNMVGREIKEKFPRVECSRGEKLLEIKNLNAGKAVRDIHFDVYAGEIVGISGLMGAGRTETTRAIFGADPKQTGEIILNGKALKISKPVDAIRHGLVLAPEDRKKDGLCVRLSIRENIALPNLDIICSKLGIVNKKAENRIVKDAVKNFNIKLSNADADASSLSGGNQQKVVVSKWLARDSKVVIFDEPTRGIDVAAKVEIYNLMNQLKLQGIGVVFVSSEMPEILGISDRILVMCDGRITGELNTKTATQSEILELATRFESKVTIQ
ncbi:MAG TPA: sugar ABC transporter ATP-binding protein [Anaerovoracaceae bacterium]|nr:sugar ABC transporter ATP-binding protein [Anaerovoracaceae bacterium]